MFQRLKGAIDSRIAEEQARQRLSQASPSRSSSNAPRSSSRNLSPSKKASRQVRGRQDGESPAKGSDPAEFEPENLIEDDGQSRSGTPRPAPDRNGAVATEQRNNDVVGGDGSQESAETSTSAEEPRSSSDLSTDVRVKLRKLEKLESRYHELLRSYRIAHARVLTIEPFETSLRENTPLTSISDPKALVEYLNQVNLKGDMVVDELKRVSNERDDLKQKLSDAEKSSKDAWDEVTSLRNTKDSHGKTDEVGRADVARPDNDGEAEDVNVEDPLGASNKSSPDAIKPPPPSTRGLSLLSPKSKPTEPPKVRQGSEDLFSYDDEIPRLETELKDRQSKIEGLETEVKTLKGDLVVTRESTQSMVQSLEEATRELNSLRESKDRSGEEKFKLERSLRQLRDELQAAKDRLQVLQREHDSYESTRISELEADLRSAKEQLNSVESVGKEDTDARTQIKDLEAAITNLEREISDQRINSGQSEKKIETLSKIIATLRSQLKEVEDENQDLKAQISKASAMVRDKLGGLEAQTSAANPEEPQDTAGDGLQSTKNEPAHTQEASSTSKKKAKKKKKAAKSSAGNENDSQVTPTIEHDTKVSETKEPLESNTVSRLQEELRHLQDLLIEKDAAIERMHGKLKDQDGLREEIDTLRDDLVNVGQEHVETKDKVKELVVEKVALETKVADLERELSELQNVHQSGVAGSEQRHSDLAAQFEGLKVKTTTLQTDLSATQQLASSRFKDLNELRNVLQKAQPEINALKSEAAEVKSVKEALTRKDAEFKRLDSRHEEMRSEVAGLKRTIADRESEIESINQKIAQESSGRLKAEEASSKRTQEVQRLEIEKQSATESLDRLTRGLAKSQEELLSSKSRLKDIELQLSKVKNDNEGLKEELDLKTAQYASAQSLMASMRDQTTEMAMQTREARERCESLDEEVAEAHRLLGERSREGETMRRLLADVESRTDARTREMKERMDAAIEERDRAEDEASTAGRRKARELEDLRNRCRDMERSMKRAEEDKEELETAQRDWKRRREELEHRASQSTREAEEVRRAMGDLRDALDESEKQARELEKQKAELRRSVEESQHRLEKLQKSNKSMADEIGKFQTARTKAADVDTQSSRSSPNSTPRLGTPAPKSRTSSAALIDAPNGQPPGAMDFVYLKNVLLQFLEQKDKKHQMQLIPVLGMLLHFDRKDEQKWMSAITSKT